MNVSEVLEEHSAFKYNRRIGATATNKEYSYFTLSAALLRMVLKWRIETRRARTGAIRPR